MDIITQELCYLARVSGLKIWMINTVEFLMQEATYILITDDSITCLIIS